MPLVEGTDYCFIYPKDNATTVHVKLLEGLYKDIVFKYGKVKFEPEGENIYLRFAFDVIESPYVKTKKLEKDMNFKNYLGDLLVEIMSSNIDQEVFDETGTIE